MNGDVEILPSLCKPPEKHNPVVEIFLKKKRLPGSSGEALEKNN